MFTVLPGIIGEGRKQTDFLLRSGISFFLLQFLLKCLKLLLFLCLYDLTMIYDNGAFSLYSPPPPK